MVATLYKHNGLFLRRAAYPDYLGRGSFATSSRCCCNIPCCNRLVPVGTIPAHLPTTLNLHLTNVGDCTCIDGIDIELTWNSTNKQYEGVGPGSSGCALLSETWRLSCTGATNPDPNASDCQHWQLSIGEVTACIMVNDPYFPLTGCSCYPLTLEYDLAFVGINCCDLMEGVAYVHALVTEALGP